MCIRDRERREGGRRRRREEAEDKDGRQEAERGVRRAGKWLRAAAFHVLDATAFHVLGCSIPCSQCRSIPCSGVQQSMFFCRALHSMFLSISQSVF
eukprot:1693905-Rhodomonas_salina.1